MGCPTSLSIGQGPSECLLSKLSEEVHPDYPLCERKYWGKKCLCSDKASVLDGGPVSRAGDKKRECGQHSGAGKRPLPDSS